MLSEATEKERYPLVAFFYPSNRSFYSYDGCCYSGKLSAGFVPCGGAMRKICSKLDLEKLESLKKNKEKT